MSDRSRTENNRKEESQEEKLFRAMSGVDEELLLRSEQSGNSGKVHKFPMRYVSRIAAACLCFVVAGVLYVTMSGTKMADSTSNDTAAPQLAYSVNGDAVTREENEAAMAEHYAAERTEEAGNDTGMNGENMSGAAMAEAASELPEGADSCCDGGAIESSMSASDDEMQEEEVMEKQGRLLPGKMMRKGQ